MTKFQCLYIAINEMLSALGAEGEIDSDHPKVSAVMNALYDIDEGFYNPDIDMDEWINVKDRLPEEL